jgi:hypothetical protein
MPALDCMVAQLRSSDNCSCSSPLEAAKVLASAHQSRFPCHGESITLIACLAYAHGCKAQRITCAVCRLAVAAVDATLCVRLLSAQ